MLRKLLSGAVPVAIVLVGLGAFALLRSMGEPPARVERDFSGPLVEGIAAPARSVQVVVEGQGTVEPGAQVGLVPQVSGIAVWTSPDLEPGGSFRRGELLVRIDAEEYELAVARSEADVARAEYQLDVARGEAEVARREWELLHAGDEGAGQPDPLVLRKPQVRAATADMKSARARLSEARLRLARTRLSAPFDGRVRSSTLDAGQFLAVGQPVAQLYSTERAEISVPVPDEEMAWLDLDGSAGGGDRSKATGAQVVGESGERGPRRGPAPLALISGSYAGRHHQWRGRAVRTQGEIDPRSRMVHVLVEVDEPYAARAEATAPLMVGMFVDVEIAGRQLQEVRAVPRVALRPGNRVWVAGRAGVLHIRPAEVVRAGRAEVLARFELAPDERVVISQINGVTDGMKVRLTRAGRSGSGADAGGEAAL